MSPVFFCVLSKHHLNTEPPVRLILYAYLSPKNRLLQEAQEYLERQAIEDLIALSGRIRIDLDWEKEEQVELDEYRDHR